MINKIRIQLVKLQLVKTIQLLVLMLMTASVQAQSADKLVIAHRGASGYLPEHTLPAKAMAYAMGADYVEQDIVMTKDDALIVLHDITLDRTTNVAELFPDRARADGRYYAIDFTLVEIRQLQATEGFRLTDGQREQVFGDRFPMGKASFSVPTLQEEIEMVQGLNRSTGRQVGIYPEIKGPEFHRAEGKDISSAVVAVLKEYGYTSKSSPVFLQTFSYDELRIIAQEILPAAGISVNLVQLMGDSDEYQWMLSAQGMQEVAQFADGIGPAMSLIVDPESTRGNVRVMPLVTNAHAAGLQIHPYTFRRDPGMVPDYADSFTELLNIHLFTAGVDGVFTDFPDVAVQFLQARNP